MCQVETHSKCNYRSYQSKHENFVTDIQVTVFCCQHFTKKIDIFCHASVQVILVVHDFLYTPFVRFPAHFMKVAKWDQIVLLVFEHRYLSG